MHERDPRRDPQPGDVILPAGSEVAWHVTEREPERVRWSHGGRVSECSLDQWTEESATDTVVYVAGGPVPHRLAGRVVQIEQALRALADQVAALAEAIDEEDHAVPADVGLGGATGSVTRARVRGRWGVGDVE